MKLSCPQLPQTPLRLETLRKLAQRLQRGGMRQASLELSTLNGGIIVCMDKSITCSGNHHAQCSLCIFVTSLPILPSWRRQLAGKGFLRWSNSLWRMMLRHFCQILGCWEAVQALDSPLIGMPIRHK